jgi:predicted phosphodiesterase
VVGDIHTRADRLQWALDVLRANEVEQVCATGDIVDGPNGGTEIARICEQLRSADAIAVLGNHDRWFLDNELRDLEGATLREDVDAATREYLQHLPASVELATSQGLLILGHGLGGNDMGALRPYDHGPSLRDNDALQELLGLRRYRFVVNGHTHVRMVRQLDGVTFINAGSLHAKREPCCCVVLDFARMRAQFFDQGADGATVVGPQLAL